MEYIHHALTGVDDFLGIHANPDHKSHKTDIPAWNPS